VSTHIGSLKNSDSYENPIEGKTYISPSFADKFVEGGKVRVVTRCIDSSESYEFARIKDEIVLRLTRGGKNIIKATVVEDTNQIKILNIQQHTASTGNPHKLNFAFIGDEIDKLFDFIKDVKGMQFSKNQYQRLNDDDLERVVLTDKQAAKLIRQQQDVFANLANSEITTKDIVAYGYRKKQLVTFDKLLSDHKYFTKAMTRKGLSNERLWQAFFEKNHWIFGYGLGYLFLTGLDEKNWNRRYKDMMWRIVAKE